MIGLGGKERSVRVQRVCCPEVQIDILIGDTGECDSEYGGLIIRVNDPRNFPWEHVFMTLLKLNHQVYVEEREGVLTIISKPKID